MKRSSIRIGKWIKFEMSTDLFAIGALFILFIGLYLGWFGCSISFSLPLYLVFGGLPFKSTISSFIKGFKFLKFLR